MRNPTHPAAAGTLAGRLAGLLAGLLLAPLAPADEPAAEADEGKIRAHLEFLADDLLEGRASGTRGYRIAARYVASQFAAAGLEPAGPEGEWFQDVPLREARLVQGSARATLAGLEGDVDLEWSTEFLMSPDPLNLSSRVSAPVTFAGFGVTAPELDYDDYDDLDVQGRVVAMFRGAPERFPHNQRAYYSSTRTKIQNAVDRGAVGVIWIRTDADNERVSWARIVGYFAFPSMRWVGPDGAVNGTWPEIKGNAYLSPRGFTRLFEAAGRDPDEIQARAKAGTPGGFDLGLTATLSGESTHTATDAPNVAGLVRGADPVLADEYVVFTAHLDHVGVGPASKGDGIYNGAYDNAMGTALLLEAARLFAESSERPRRSLLFLAVSAEEKGLLGSDYFAEHPTVPLESVVANVNLDMPLFLYPLADVIAFGAEHSSLAEPVATAAAATGFDVTPDPWPEEVIFIRSDQFSFVRRGVPSVFLVPGIRSRDGSVDGAAMTRAFMTTHYHRPSDDLALAYDGDSARRFAQMNYLLGRAVANERKAPRWNVGDFFGDKFAPAGAKGARP